jgi:peptidoglycan hydrolase-like protein with peptidoglycan-binding domain
MGLYKNGKPDKAAIMAFQEKNGLTKDGIIGPDTSGAIISAAKPGDAGSGRGGQGGPAAYKQNMPPMPTKTQQAATPVPVDPTKQSVNQRLSTGPSLIDQGRARLGIPAGGTSPSPMRESSFEESVDRMRRLSNMLKG